MRRFAALLLSLAMIMTFIPAAWGAEAGDLAVKSVSVSLNSSLAINYYVDASSVAGYDSVYMEFRKPVYGSDGSVESTVVENVDSFRMIDGMRVYTLRNITAREIGTTVAAKVCGTKNGTMTTGKQVNYSVKKYAVSQLEYTTDPKLKRLAINLLNYGAAAQTYWSYRTGSPANASLTQEQLAMTAEQPVEWCNHNHTERRTGATASVASCSLSLKEQVTLNYYLDLSAYPGDVQKLELVIRHGGQISRIPASSFVSRGNGSYLAQLWELSASMMRTVCVAELHDTVTDQPVSSALSYSIITYASAAAAGTDTRLAELVTAMMRYGDSAMEFFRKQPASNDDAHLRLQGLQWDTQSGRADWQLRLCSAEGSKLRLDDTKSYDDLRVILLMPKDAVPADPIGGNTELVKSASAEKNYLGSGKTALIVELNAAALRQTERIPVLTFRTFCTTGDALPVTACLVSSELSVPPESVLSDTGRYASDQYDLDQDGHSLEPVRTASDTFYRGIDEGEGEI